MAVAVPRPQLMAKPLDGRMTVIRDGEMTPHHDSSTPSGSGRQFDLNLRPGAATPIPRMVNLIVLEALNAGAQQIHVHLHTGTVAVRYFLTGEWIQVMEVPAAAFGPLINRLRVMAGLDRTKGNTRQEGNVEVVADGAPVAIRVVVQFTETGDEEAYIHLPSSEQE